MAVPQKFKSRITIQPAVLLLGIYLEELKAGSRRDNLSNMFIEALFIIPNMEATQLSIEG